MTCCQCKTRFRTLPDEEGDHACPKCGYHPSVKTQDETEPDWTRNCLVCGETPILPVTGMCGPCTFGEADTAGGNW